MFCKNSFKLSCQTEWLIVTPPPFIMLDRLRSEEFNCALPVRGRWWPEWWGQSQRKLTWAFGPGGTDSTEQTVVPGLAHDDFTSVPISLQFLCGTSSRNPLRRGFHTGTHSFCWAQLSGRHAGDFTEILRIWASRLILSSSWTLLRSLSCLLCAFQDVLKIYFSTTCHSTWSSRRDKLGPSLATPSHVSLWSEPVTSVSRVSFTKFTARRHRRWWKVQ